MNEALPKVSAEKAPELPLVANDNRRPKSPLELVVDNTDQEKLLHNNLSAERSRLQKMLAGVQAVPWKDIGQRIGATASYIATHPRESAVKAKQLTQAIGKSVHKNLITYQGAREVRAEQKKTAETIASFDELSHDLLATRQRMFSTEGEAQTNAKAEMKALLGKLKEVNSTLPRAEAEKQRAAIAAILSENRTRKAEAAAAVSNDDERMQANLDALQAGIGRSKALLKQEARLEYVEKVVGPTMLRLSLLSGVVGVALTGVAAGTRLGVNAAQRKVSLERKRHREHTKSESDKTAVTFNTIVVGGVKEAMQKAKTGDINTITKMAGFLFAGGVGADQYSSGIRQEIIDAFAPKAAAGQEDMGDFADIFAGASENAGQTPDVFYEPPTAPVAPKGDVGGEINIPETQEGPVDRMVAPAPLEAPTDDGAYKAPEGVSEGVSGLDPESASAPLTVPETPVDATEAIPTNTPFAKVLEQLRDEEVSIEKVKDYLIVKGIIAESEKAKVSLWLSVNFFHIDHINSDSPFLENQGIRSIDAGDDVTLVLNNDETLHAVYSGSVEGSFSYGEHSKVTYVSFYGDGALEEIEGGQLEYAEFEGQAGIIKFFLDGGVKSIYALTEEGVKVGDFTERIKSISYFENGNPSNVVATKEGVVYEGVRFSRVEFNPDGSVDRDAFGTQVLEDAASDATATAAAPINPVDGAVELEQPQVELTPKPPATETVADAPSETVSLNIDSLLEYNKQFEATDNVTKPLPRDGDYSLWNIAEGDLAPGTDKVPMAIPQPTIFAEVENNLGVEERNRLIAEVVKEIERNPEAREALGMQVNNNPNEWLHAGRTFNVDAYDRLARIVGVDCGILDKSALDIPATADAAGAAAVNSVPSESSLESENTRPQARPVATSEVSTAFAGLERNPFDTQRGVTSTAPPAAEAATLAPSQSTENLSKLQEAYNNFQTLGISALENDPMPTAEATEQSPEGSILERNPYETRYTPQEQNAVPTEGGSITPETVSHIVDVSLDGALQTNLKALLGGDITSEEFAEAYGFTEYSRADVTSDTFVVEGPIDANGNVERIIGGESLLPGLNKVGKLEFMQVFGDGFAILAGENLLPGAVDSRFNNVTGAHDVIADMNAGTVSQLHGKISGLENFSADLKNVTAQKVELASDNSLIVSTGSRSGLEGLPYASEKPITSVIYNDLGELVKINVGLGIDRQSLSPEEFFAANLQSGDSDVNGELQSAYSAFENNQMPSQKSVTPEVPLPEQADASTESVSNNEPEEVPSVTAGLERNPLDTGRGDLSRLELPLQERVENEYIQRLEAYETANGKSMSDTDAEKLLQVISDRAILQEKLDLIPKEGYGKASAEELLGMGVDWKNYDFEALPDDYVEYKEILEAMRDRNILTGNETVKSALERGLSSKTIIITNEGVDIVEKGKLLAADTVSSIALPKTN